MILTPQFASLSNVPHQHRRRAVTAVDGYRVRAVSGAAARDFLPASRPGVHRVRLSVGLFSATLRGRDGRPALVGVVTLSAPVGSSLLTTQFPWLIPFEQSAELGDPVLRFDVPAEVAAWFVVQARRVAARHGVTGVAVPAASGPVLRAEGERSARGRSLSGQRAASGCRSLRRVAA
ncbi:hypothetical protein ACFCZ5_34825 [Streptomyces microflavus]|uniref:hypothetical protein n=1 Tax=Streptomyces microflavus TaxID=1919 RepID=UPI0035DCDB09